MQRIFDIVRRLFSLIPHHNDREFLVSSLTFLISRRPRIYSEVALPQRLSELLAWFIQVDLPEDLILELLSIMYETEFIPTMNTVHHGMVCDASDGAAPGIAASLSGDVGSGSRNLQHTGFVQHGDDSTNDSNTEVAKALPSVVLDRAAFRPGNAQGGDDAAIVRSQRVTHDLGGAPIVPPAALAAPAVPQPGVVAADIPADESETVVPVVESEPVSASHGAVAVQQPGVGHLVVPADEPVARRRQCLGCLVPSWVAAWLEHFRQPELLEEVDHNDAGDGNQHM
jgi:hypothetical protein